MQSLCLVNFMKTEFSRSYDVFGVTALYQSKKKHGTDLLAMFSIKLSCELVKQSFWEYIYEDSKIS